MNNETQIINNIDAFYKILSGPKSSSRDWSRFKELFCQNATLCPHKKASNGSNSEIFGIDVYIERLKKFLADNDFYEFGVDYKMNIYGNICSVYNVYQAFSDPNRNNWHQSN